MHILFVCRSNFCRSPLAEGIFSAKVKDAKLESHYWVDSAGTHGYQVGLLPDKNAQSVAAHHGLSLEGQQSRQIDLGDFEQFDLIFAMDHDNFAHLKSLSPTAFLDKIYLLAPFGESAQTEILDPYGMPEDGFEVIYQQLDKACEGVLHLAESRRQDKKKPE